MVRRNPYVQDDLLASKKRLALLLSALNHRLAEIDKRRDADLFDEANDKSSAPKDEALTPSDRVNYLLTTARRAVDQFKEEFNQINQLRARAKKVLSRYTHADNIKFDGLSRVSHATDATDWRVEFPFVVLTPDHEAEMVKLIRACF